ncbi:hypothetical protein AVEN_70393-1 [Araneus ventricosus]|uniref:Uncharacterized protein n=1 Tax=Araneus ventricosus TaxID=182803 RepID=A0A4Y2V1M6_ARAVE|nr:hypothetical protein AVEN_70393-1 [Araneus ventricosus]
MAAKGTEMRFATEDADTYIRRSGLEKATSHPKGKGVDLVVLLIALAPPESNIYFMKLGKGKVEAKLFFTRKLQKEFFLTKPSSFSMHSVAPTLLQIFIEKAKHYSYIVQKSTKPDNNIAVIFYNPSSTPDAISQTGENMFLVQSRC